ncbi:hypothetical protein L0669_04210 [Flavobacterium bizetiae]|uniref:hypothetical protein n=1 Tax=Flavobacterium bizetiae TaxID=2704140 RepID=UPI0021E80C8F|nr:hypothetical protein [Flavobacterium bizetiae]UTN05111.1 hypothetical protein L0669_04210 [Flavobacterium bizetiae]
MKKTLFLFIGLYNLFSYGQTFDGNLGSKSLNWNQDQKDFLSPPRVGVSPMSVKLWDNYNGMGAGAPTNFGSLLEISGQVGHLVSQLYFDNTWNGGRILYRSAFYGQDAWESWRYLLDSKSDVESSGTLKINGAGANYITGNLGIGVANPSNDQNWGKVLDVAGVSSSKILATSLNSNYKVGIFSHSSWYGGGGFLGTESDHPLHLITNYNSKMSILTNGNVGIGISDPKNKLDVNGTIHSKEVKVDMDGWSDFVFKKEYNLPTLNEVEKHIAEKGHLENIPSEAEVLKNGINLGEMNVKLLQKIEELTLYMIEMKKENEELTLYTIEQEKKNNKQSLRIDALEKENKTFKNVFERLSKIEEKLK